jgi:hypothetical protein
VAVHILHGGLYVITAWRKEMSRQVITSDATRQGRTASTRTYRVKTANSRQLTTALGRTTLTGWMEMRWTCPGSRDGQKTRGTNHVGYTSSAVHDNCKLSTRAIGCLFNQHSGPATAFRVPPESKGRTNGIVANQHSKRAETAPPTQNSSLEPAPKQVIDVIAAHMCDSSSVQVA